MKSLGAVLYEGSGVNFAFCLTRAETSRISLDLGHLCQKLFLQWAHRDDQQPRRRQLWLVCDDFFSGSTLAESKAEGAIFSAAGGTQRTELEVEENGKENDAQRRVGHHRGLCSCSSSVQNRDWIG